MTLQDQLQNGCSKCGKKPLAPDEAHTATMRLALPKFDTSGIPLPDEKLNWTPGRAVILCSECASTVEVNTDPSE